MLPHVHRRFIRYTLLTESTAHKHGNPLFLEAFETFVPFVVRNTD
jgi:hypothetical protein